MLSILFGTTIIELKQFIFINNMDLLFILVLCNLRRLGLTILNHCEYT